MNIGSFGLCLCPFQYIGEGGGRKCRREMRGQQASKNWVHSLAVIPEQKIQTVIIKIK
jgi:hypothetical protein